MLSALWFLTRSFKQSPCVRAEARHSIPYQFSLSDLMTGPAALSACTATIEDLVTSEPPLYAATDYGFFAVCTDMLNPVRSSIIPAGTTFDVTLPKKAHRDGHATCHQSSSSSVTITVAEDIGLLRWYDPCVGVLYQDEALKHVLMQYWLHFVSLRAQINGRPDEPFDPIP